MRKLGVPYTDADVDARRGRRSARRPTTIVADLAASGVKVDWNTEMVALIAYLQRLGRDQGVAPTTAPAVAAAGPTATPPGAAASH